LDPCNGDQMSQSETSLIGALEAEARFSELLDRATLGEEITITRHGTAVARLVPPIHPPTTPDSRRKTIAAMRQLSEGKRLEGVAIHEMIAEGRR
jgi:prevent-host-death family protein